ncbi:Baseplate J-like protein [Vibrio quintilis]|uniref:Baseplate J-like protein n=2 Tax=Vibrio quintilis TaxID=1117707 RepID=A0A1M7YV70_9VIBR|nr:Baseplate J-like protein [Vibrio quintilis]
MSDLITKDYRSSFKDLKRKNQALNGLTQTARVLEALQGDYFSIEERTFSEWMAYLRKAAHNIRFYNDQTFQPDGHWGDALPGIIQSQSLENLLNGLPVPEETKTLASRPDIAALLAFFTLMTHPKGQFDALTERHKQHYYQDVLGFAPLAAQPDQVHLVIGLDEDTPGMTLPAGTCFTGPTDSNDLPLVYETETQAALNHTQVVQMKTLSGVVDLREEKGLGIRKNEQRILTQVIDTENGLELDSGGVLTFGDDLAETQTPGENQQFSRIGLTIASPALYLAGGTRTVTLICNRASGTESSPLSLKQWFDIAVSTADGMITYEHDLLTQDGNHNRDENESNWTIDENSDGLCMEFSSLFPAITGLEGEQAPGVTSLPHFVFSLRPNQEKAAAILKKSIFTAIELNMDVCGLPGLIAGSDDGSLDTASPFEPLTGAPKIGSRLTFTHPELLVKPITDADITFHWIGRPVDLNEHYRIYAEYRDFTGQSSDQFSEPLRSNTWPKPKFTFTRSDDLSDPGDPIDMFSNHTPVDNIDIHTIAFISASDNGPVYSWDTLPLDEPAGNWPRRYNATLVNNDFGHGEFAQVSQYAAYLNSQQSGTKEEGELRIVPDPYTPELEQLTLNYSCSVTLEASALASMDSPALQFLHPLGRPRIVASGATMTLLPYMPENAYLYIGLNQTSLPGSFRFYFQVDPVDSSNISDNSYVKWEYMTPQGWQLLLSSADGAQMGQPRIIEDSTQLLLNSGIVVLELPAMDESLSGLGDGLLWLQVSIFNQNSDSMAGDLPGAVRYSALRGIYPQGVVATLITEEVDPSHYQQPLPAESVTELDVPDERISSVTQPWPGFGARVEETESELSVRASERLRHKQRALTRWDYEHLVLNSFPEVYMARCYAPQENELNSESDISVVVIPVNYDTSILQPKLPLYLRQQIETMLEEVSPSGVSVTVKDPVYEEVHFDVLVKIFSGYDIDSVVREINQILINYLTPWQSDSDEDPNFRQAIYFTELALALEQHPAVDVVHHIRATVDRPAQILPGVPNSFDETDNIIQPGQEDAILVPSHYHKIVLVDQDLPIVEGIGKWRVEIDLTVS